MESQHPARLDPHRFIALCMIRPALGGGLIRFLLWDFQAEVLDEIHDNARSIILKARQLGLSWLVLAYALWLALTPAGNQTILILNRNEDEAAKLLKRIKLMHDNLPMELQQDLVTDKFTELEFANGSRVLSLAAVEDAGSGETANLVIVDEWSKIRLAESILTAIIPTLAAGGKLIGIATAKGYHNHFAAEWRRAVDGVSEFMPIFIPWHAHPDRSETWYQRQARTFSTTRALQQEYPASWQQAFQSLEGVVFGDEFDRMDHVVAFSDDPDILRDVNAGWPTVRGVDFGYHHSPVYWAEIQGADMVYVFDELDAQKMTTQDLATAILARDRELGVDTDETWAGCDPAGVAMTAAATHTDHDVLRAAGIPVRGENDNQERVPPSDRVDLIKRLLRDGKLIIHPRCIRLIAAFEQAEWDRVGKDGVLKETYSKDGLHEHYLDSLGYMLVNVFPQGGKATGSASRTSAPVASAYSLQR